MAHLSIYKPSQQKKHFLIPNIFIDLKKDLGKKCFNKRNPSANHQLRPSSLSSTFYAN